jgi:hypothetical protein
MIALEACGMGGMNLTPAEAAQWHAWLAHAGKCPPIRRG